MNTSVNIGSCQDFRLSRAVLVYGTSSYEGIPYRHPFVTLHEVIHDGPSARLAAGQLMTPQMLIDLLMGLGRSLPIEILPERVLVRTAETIVWWTPGSARTLFFGDRGADPVLKKINGKRYPHPSLLFKACGSHLWVRALDEGKRPECGNKAVHGALLELLRQRSGVHWKHADSAGEIGISNRRLGAVISSRASLHMLPECASTPAFPAELLAMWQFLAGKENFPSEYLVKLRQTFSEFVNDNDHTYRNEVQPRSLSIGFQTACCGRKSELRWLAVVEQEAPSQPVCRTCIKP